MHSVLRRRATGLALLFLVSAPLAVRGHAQVASTSKKICILAAGGLLGQHDGMPEYPGGVFDTDLGAGIRPYGGLDGLVDWKKDRMNDPTQPRPDLFLLTANNQPLGIGNLLLNPNRGRDNVPVTGFWKLVHDQLQPDAVGLGMEDFLRALASPGTAGPLVAWLRGEVSWAPNLTFLASNTAVRLHGPRLNHVTDHGFTLQVDETASLGWVSSVGLTFPCVKTGLRAVLTPDDTARKTTATTQPRISGGDCRGRVSFTKMLQPGEHYTLELRVNDRIEATFNFFTDQLLTRQPAYVPDRPELPIVLSLVDTRVRAMLSDSKWRWPGGANCPAASCEIVFLPPLEAFDQVLALTGSDRSTRPVALMSALTDKDTFAVLQHSPRVRFVVFPPETAALGRAAERTDDAKAGGAGGRGRPAPAGGAAPNGMNRSKGVPPPYSGDLGYGAVLNPSTKEASQIWSRPEWFAETAQEMLADVTHDTDLDTWNLDKAEHTSASVPGRALCAKTTGGNVAYYLARMDKETGAYTVEANAFDGAPRYPDVAPDVPYDKPSRTAQGSLWTDADAFAAMALDVMRTGLHAELGLLPANAVDENWLLYLKRDAHAPTQALSRVILDRVLFRAGAVIKVRVSGASMVTTVNKILSAGRAEDVDYCLSGFGTTTCGTSRLDLQRALVNGRGIDKNRLYTIAMPEIVALANGLAPYGHGEGNLVALIDGAFAGRPANAPNVDTCAARYQSTIADSADKADDLPTRLERADAALHTSYLFVKPADLSFSETQVSEPAGGQGLFNKLPIQNNGAKPSRRFATNLGIDYGVFDTRRFVVRAMSTIGYGHAKVNGQTSIDPNLATLAIRADLRLPALGARVFAGPYYESQFGDQTTAVTVSKTGVTVPLVTARREYTYFGAGFELERPQVRTWLTIDPLRITMAFGESAREHVDVTINGVSQGLAAFQQLGATGLLSQFSASHPGTVTADTPYLFVDNALRRNRFQADATPDVKWTVSGKTLDLSLMTTFRRWVGPNLVPLAERQSLQMKLTLAIPFAGLATLNLNGSEYLVQVNGLSGWFKVWQPSVSVSIPVVFSRRAGWTY